MDRVVRRPYRSANYKKKKEKTFCFMYLMSNHLWRMNWSIHTVIIWKCFFRKLIEIHSGAKNFVRKIWFERKSSQLRMGWLQLATALTKPSMPAKSAMIAQLLNLTWPQASTFLSWHVYFKLFWVYIKFSKSS